MPRVRDIPPPPSGSFSHDLRPPDGPDALRRALSLGTTARSVIQSGWHGALGLFYPQVCAGCRAALGAQPRGAAPSARTPLCPACLRTLEQPEPNEVAAHVGASLGVAAASLATCRALWRFETDGPLRAVQHALKYGNQPRLGEALGALLGQHLAAAPHAALAPPAPAEPADAEPLPTLVPIPLHRARYIERGYNQSERLARGLADVLGLPLSPSLLARSRATASQTTLDHRARWRNVRGAFVAQPDAAGLAGRRIVLVDDVLTTGATLAAAATALRNAGAARVDAVTLAWTR